MNINNLLNAPLNNWTIIPEPIQELSRLYTLRLRCSFNSSREQVDVFESVQHFTTLLRSIYNQYQPIRWRIYLFHRETLQINRINLDNESRFVYFRLPIDQRVLNQLDIERYARQLSNRLLELAMQYVEEDDDLLEAYHIYIDVKPTDAFGNGLVGWPQFFKNEWCNEQVLFNPQGSSDCLAKCIAEKSKLNLSGILELFNNMLNGEETLPDLMEELQNMFPQYCFRVFSLNLDLIVQSPSIENKQFCNLLLSDRHYFLIKDLNRWLALFEESELNKFCEDCCHRYPADLQHHCRGQQLILGQSCNHCGKEFQNFDQIKYHRRNMYKDLDCESPTCSCGNANFISKQCFSHHKSQCLVYKEQEKEQQKLNKQEYERERGKTRGRTRNGLKMIKCKGCDKRYAENTQHYCYFKKLELKPENKHDSYYVFDFESLFVENPEHVGTFEHQVNYVYVRKLWDNDFEKEFNDIDSFVSWLNEIKDENAWLAAHNFRGYDGRLLHAALLRNCPVEMTNYITVGTKLNTFKYGNLKFADSLLHIAQPLDQFPKSFGLQIECKGFFPYSFNTPENQSYVGPIPDQKYFQPEKMSIARREKFLKWYSDQQGQVYDFHKELVDYCKLDVEIMKQGLEVYADSSKAVNQGMNPLDYLTTASYSYNVWRTLHMPENTLVYFKKEFHDVARLALRGGRTDVRCILKEWSKEDVLSGKSYGVYADVQSMYPYIMYTRDLPVGKPKRIHHFVPQLTFGIVHCDLNPPPQYQHHPALCVRDETTGRLVAPLSKELLTNLYLCSPELEDALAQGYTIAKLHFVDVYEKSNELFREYISKFLKIKVEKSQALPPEEEFEVLQRTYAAFGVVLDRSEFEYNPGRRQLAKNSLNNLWGKLCERVKHDKTLHLIDPEKFFDLELLEEMGQFNPTMKLRINNNSWFIRGEWLDDQKRQENEEKNRERTMPVIGAFITMYGRKMLFDQMKKLDKRALYHDTDSIVYDYQTGQGQYNIELGHCLGDWEDELKGKRMTHFTAIAPKTYAYKYLDHKKPLDHPPTSPDQEYWEWNGKFYVLNEVVKIKGIKQSYQTSKTINYKSIKALALKEQEQITTTQLNFIWNQKHLSMHTKDTPKITSFNYLKGSLGQDKCTYPPGVEMYQNWKDDKVCQTGAPLRVSG